MRIYTRTGDSGATGLLDGSRVPKSHLRVVAYGEVDEVSALLGLIRSETDDSSLAKLLGEVQRDLFALGAQLADPKARIGRRRPKALIPPERVAALESTIDECEARLPPLRAFILSGGSPTGALLHLARTTTRRAERSVVALARRSSVDPSAIVYLNRLSDLLFVLARDQNRRAARPEETW